MEHNQSILHKISQMYSQMSPSQQMIANVILKDAESAAFYNVAEMSKAASVSESTVTRFSTYIGCSGYPALSRELQELVRSKLTTGERFHLSREIDNDEQQTVIQYFEDDLHNLTLMMERIDLEAFGRVVKSLLGAKRIGIVCSRSAVSIGLFFEFYLNLLNKESILLTGDPRTVDHIHKFGEDDVLIGIGFARYSRFTVDCLKYGKKKGVHVVAITDYPSSPLVGCSTDVLYTPTGIPSHMDSFVAPLSLITAILRAMSQQSTAQATDVLNELEDAWTNFDIYVEPKK
ncbi:MurR/RpiR family transcriptional regulator [Brevibacillus daliensis]|uniref:MurR/RpiR family transcriptional regulator n=1 Tax=Brevibacillus daliensis TaxID=2892995 RepID=UPI001E39FA8E|nr:MurR/RpiR family transcriptional regulator [Brevibacillus daliensis]